jgi:hypothetical protein
MVYNSYEDEKLLKNQGGISKDSLIAKGAEGLGRAVVNYPGAFVNTLRDMAVSTPVGMAAGRIATDAKAQNETLNRGNVNLALDSDKLRTDIASGNFPRRLNELLNSPVSPIGNLTKLSEKLPVNPNIDQRFQDMQAGIRGVSQDQIRDAQSRGLQYKSNDQGDLIRAPKLNQLPNNQTPTFTNARGMLQARDQDGNLMSRQTGIDANRQNELSRLAQNPIKTNDNILASRQPGQVVRYSRNGLTAEFAPNTSNQEISAFTDSHRRESGITAQNEAAQAENTKYLRELAMEKARSGIMDMPQKPDVRGMSPNERKDAIDAYQAELSYAAQVNQTAMQGKNYQGQNANAAEQNAISREHYGVTGANDTLRAQTDATTKTQEMNLANSKDIETQRALMNATPEQRQAYYLGQKEQKPNIEKLKVPIDPNNPLLGEQDILVNTDTNKQINYDQKPRSTSEAQYNNAKKKYANNPEALAQIEQEYKARRGL